MFRVKETGTKSLPSRKKWSRCVMQRSDALDLESAVFTFDDPHRIAGALKCSTEKSQRRQVEPFRSAMSMLSFYINRAGKKLDGAQRMRLEHAKKELRNLFDKQGAE